MQTEQLTWPPEYRLRKSRRAKYLQLKVSREIGLEVIVPYRFGYYDLNSFLLTHREWIQKKLAIHQARVEKNKNLPERIHIQMNDEVWYVKTLSAMGKAQLITRPDNTLVLMGELTDLQFSQSLIKKWLRKRARNLLVPLIENLSVETGLKFNKISIRDQRTRWGSCSSKGDIALNYKLILLALPLVRYILIHELCHTRHLNHSKQFWALVAQYDPDYRRHKREIQHLE